MEHSINYHYVKKNKQKNALFMPCGKPTYILLKHLIQLQFLCTVKKKAIVDVIKVFKLINHLEIMLCHIQLIQNVKKNLDFNWHWICVSGLSRVTWITCRTIYFYYFRPSCRHHRWIQLFMSSGSAGWAQGRCG